MNMRGPSSPENPGASAGPPAGSALPDLSTALRLVRRAQQGDLLALRDLLWSYRGRLRRIVGIRTGSRLYSLLEAEELLQDAYLLAMRKLGDLECSDHAGILQWLARIAESQVRSKFDYFLGQRRAQATMQLRVSTGAHASEHGDPGGPPSPRDELRIEFERLVDALVEELDPPALREVLLQRDYCASDWQTVCSTMNLASVEAAQELYRVAHEKLRRRLRPHLDKPRAE